MLAQHQYYEVLNFVETLSAFQRDLKYVKLRPRNAPIIGNARAWWRYAIGVALADVSESIHRRSWAYIAQRKADRVACMHSRVACLCSPADVEAYQKVLSKTANKADAQFLEQLEDRLRFEDIVYFRSIAEAAEQRRALDKAQSPKSGWLSRECTRA